MRRALLILPLFLIACGPPPTPREQCLAAARGELPTLTRLAAETQRNIDRGYALDEVQETRTRLTFCTGTNDDGSTFRFPCEETDTITRTVPVAIDLNAERAKLDSLQERIAQEQRRAEAATAQCLALYPG